MDKYALIIGISEYDSFKTLSKTTNDAETIAKILEDFGGFNVDRLPRKANEGKDGYVMKAGKVTGDAFWRKLKEFLKRADRKDALIYFTGHGFTIVDEDIEETEGFLATSDCRVELSQERTKIVNHNNRAISLNKLNKMLGKANFSSLVVLLDCCHSGAFLDKENIKNLTTFNSQKDYFLITACRDFETAKAVKNQNHSVFSGAVIEGLSSDM